MTKEIEEPVPCPLCRVSVIPIKGRLTCPLCGGEGVVELQAALTWQKKNSGTP